MKLLYIVKSLQYGGISTVLLNKLNYLVKNTNFEIHVLSEFENDENLVSEFDKSITFHVLNIKKEVSKKRIPLVGRLQLTKEVKKKYINFINNLQPNVITDYDWGYYRDIIPYLKTEAYKIKELHTAYLSRDLINSQSNFYNKYIDKNIFEQHNNYDEVIMLTREDFEDRHYLQTKKRYIYNPITPVESSSFNERKNIGLAVGTLTKNKNFSDLIKALALIQSQLQDWEFHIYGRGDELGDLKILIERFSLEDSVKLMGFSNNMNSVYNNAKLLVSTSLSEGMPMNLLEALAYKIPIVSYNFKCGAKEIVGETNGSLININDVETLSVEILKFISNPILLEEISKKININKFDNEKIMQEWITLYNGLNYEKN